MNISELIAESKDNNIVKWDHAKKYCVYFICKKSGEILYIGQTANCYNRFSDHRHGMMNRGNELFLFYGTKQFCIKAERDLIRRIRPKYNIQTYDKERSDKKTNRHLSKNEVAEFKELLKKTMKDKGLNKSDISKILGTSSQFITQILNGVTGLSKFTAENFKLQIDMMEDTEARNG